MFSEWWWSSGAEANDDGVEIGQSLRFRNNVPTYLTNTALAGASITNYTISVWVKQGFGSYTGSKYILTSGSAGTNTSYLNFASDGTSGAFNFNEMSNGGTLVTSTARNRDPSAWYHLVASNNHTVGEQKLWVNGELVATTNGTANTNIFSQSPVQIGLYADSSYTSTAWEGYMSDFYFIDGQILEPTAFGRTNDNGVWVPREVDFTPATMRFSDFLFTSTNSAIDFNTTNRNFTGANPATNAFDGNTTTTAQRNGGDASIIFRPNEALAGVTRIEVNYGGGNGSTRAGFNSANEVDAAAAGWNEVYNGAAVDVNNIYIRNVGTLFISGIRITDANGTRILTNPFMWTAQLFTSPGYGSINYSSTDKSFQPTSPVSNGFDNQPNTFVQCNSDNSWFFKPQNLTASKIEIQVTNAYGDPTGGALEFNGVELTGFPGQDWFTVYEGAPISDWTIGGWYRPAGGNGFSMIRVNGTVLTNGVNPSYGANGFRLQFADPDDLGHDSSGNGNDFTPNGFNTGPIGIWSDMLSAGSNSSDSTGSCGTASAGQLFDSVVDGTPSSVSPETCWLYWDLSTPFKNVTQVEVFLSGLNGQSVAINGDVTYGPTDGASTWTNIPLPGEFDGTLNSMSFRASNGSNRAKAIRINGVHIVDNTGTDYDLMQDSPTQNWATGNPLHAIGSLAKANLGFGGEVTHAKTSATIALPDEGKYYWEYTNTADVTYVGFMDASINQQSSSPNGPGYWRVSSDGQYYANGSFIENTPGGAWTAGDVIGLEYDRTNDQLRFNKNGSLFYTVTLPAVGEYLLTPFLGNYSNTNTFNFGQQPFLYTPPAGFEVLQTQNLPAATIAKGRDHFQALTGPGQGADGTVVAGQLAGAWSNSLISTVGGFQPPHPATLAFDGSSATYAITETNGTWVFAPETPIPVTSTVEVFQFNTAGTTSWKGTDLTPNGGSVTFSGSGEISADYPITGTTAGASQGCFLNKIVVDGKELVDFSILALAKSAFPTGLWWIKDRVNSNQHQFVDSVRGGDIALQCPGLTQAAYLPPAGGSVAWCWKAGGAPVANNDGSIPSQVSANTDAGFSVVSYTGNSTLGVTVGHGLTIPPEFIIVKNRDNGSAKWNVYHSSIGATNYLHLNTTDSSAAAVDRWNNTSPTSSVFSLGDSVETNGSNQMIAYCWTSISGYSAFGSYQGNNSADGPFIYTGFRPAFLMCKRSNGTSNWIVYDSTRSTSNPTELFVYANLTAAETNAVKVDFLSNGFKLRDVSDPINRNSQYIYIAFAENPFGSSNTSPANAR